MERLDRNPGQTRNRKEIVFFAIILFSGILRLWFVVAVPFGESVHLKLQGLNDEPAHYNYVKYLEEKGRFPVQTRSARDPGSFERNDFEYHQAPLYYVICAFVDGLLGPRNNILACRLVSWVCGFASLFVLLAILKRLNFGREIRLAALIFWGAYLPHVYFSSLVSNDSMSWLFALLLTHQTIDLIMRNSWPVRQMALTTVLLGAGLLVKSSLFLFGPVIGIVGILAWQKHHDRAYFMRACVIGVGALVLAFPWYARNVAVYGSLFNLELANGPAVWNLWEPATFARFVKGALSGFWFPMTHLPDTTARSVLNAVSTSVLAAFVGIGIWYARRLRKVENSTLVLTALFVLNTIAYVRYNIRWTNSDPRFLLPSLVPIALFLAVPLYALMQKRGWERFYVPLAASPIALSYVFFCIV